jgi:hypothetical protein
MNDQEQVAPYHRDSRGNRLSSWTFVPGSGSDDLWLRGPAEVVHQVKATDPFYIDLAVPPPERLLWTHVLRAPGPLTHDVRQLLDILKQVLIIPPPLQAEVVLALDWYKQADANVRPFDWPNTSDGQLVHFGKYRYAPGSEEQARVGRQLAGRLASVVQLHPILRNVPTIVDVPGHDSRLRVSFGSRAATVASRLGKRMVKTQARLAFRPPAKSADQEMRAAVISGQFFFSEPISGAVLIVDDVYRSGISLSEVAKAAREAGAGTAFGLCGVLTMRAR